MLRINKHLIPLKVLLFFFFGAFGCLWPFLSVHMKKLGLNVEETAIINFVAPVVGILGPPLASLLATKTQKGKLVLVVCLMLCASAFTALLFVPPTHRHPPRNPSMFFECGVHGGLVTMERCNNECRLPERSPAPSSLALRYCQYVCDEHLGAEGPGRQAPTKPYVCVEQDNGTYCHVYNASGQALDIVLTGPFIQYEQLDGKCLYPMIREIANATGRTKPAVHCRIENSGCVVQCEGYVDSDDPSALSPFKCSQIDGRPLLTFAAYLLLRTVAEFFMFASFALLDATVMNGIWEFGGFYSQQFLWGMLAVGLLSPMVGLMVDVFNDAYSSHLPYAPAFFMFDFTVLITAVIVAAMPLSVYSGVNRLGTYVGRIARNREAVTLFVMAFALGNLFGFLETFYYWFLDDRRADAYFLGLTLMVGIFPSIPLLLFGDRIVKKCNHANILITAFFAYSFRCVVYSFAEDVWQMLPFDTLRIGANVLMWVAAMTYCEKLGPKVLASTITGSVAIMHSNVGRGVGALAGGYIMDYYCPIIAFQVAAVYAGTVGVIYLALYHFYLKFRRSPIYIETALNGHYTPMETYVNGENQIQKPMLADRDRY